MSKTRSTRNRTSKIDFGQLFHQGKKPDGDKIAAAVRGALPPPTGRTLTVAVHGLVLLVFKSSTSVSLLLPKEGMPGRKHEAFARVFSRGGFRPLALGGADWRLKGHSTPASKVRKVTRHSTEHPLTPVERILDMANVVGNARLRPLRDLIKDDLLEAAVTMSGIEIMAHVSYAPFGWNYLWKAGGEEFLCTDTAVLTVQLEASPVLSGKEFGTGQVRDEAFGSDERFLFLANLDAKDCTDAIAMPPRLDETKGYVKLYPALGQPPSIPVASRSALGDELLKDRGVFQQLFQKVLSSGCSGQCNLAADYDEDWDDSRADGRTTRHP